MKVIVTGGAGFIGSHLVELLLLKGHQVIAIDNLTCGREENFSSFTTHPLFSFVKADIRQLSVIAPHFKGVDWVFHLAALADIIPSIDHPRSYFEVNVNGTLNVLECAKTYEVKRVIYAASSSCYGIPSSYPTPETAPIQPQYPYALTKYLGERLALHWHQVYKLPVLSLRLFNVFGPRARTTGTYGAVFGVFLAQKLHKKPLTVVGDGTQTRDFTYVEDVARAFYSAAETSLEGEVFNVGSGSHYSINRIVELMKTDCIYLPERPGEPNCTFADTTKIKKLLGFSTKISFEEGVNKLLQQIHTFRHAPLWDKESIQHATKTWFHYLSSFPK